MRGMAFHKIGACQQLPLYCNLAARTAALTNARRSKAIHHLNQRLSQLALLLAACFQCFPRFVWIAEAFGEIIGFVGHARHQILYVA